MTYRIERTLRRLGQQLPGRLSLPGDDRDIAASAIWAKPAGGMPRAVAHCRTPEDVQSTIRAARSCDLPLSVRPLSEFHPDDPERFQTDTLSPYFERLRNEQPVHLCSTSPVGAYWSASTRKSQHRRRGTRDEV